MFKQDHYVEERAEDAKPAKPAVNNLKARHSRGTMPKEMQQQYVTVSFDYEGFLDDYHNNVSQIKQNKYGYWQTHYRDPITGERKGVTRKSSEELASFLMELDTRKIHYTVEDVFFKMWVPKKHEKNKDSTATRTIQLYNKYIAGTEFAKMDVTKVRSVDIEDFCQEMVCNFEMDKHRYLNAKSVINNVFKTAYLKNLIAVDPSKCVILDDDEFENCDDLDEKDDAFNTQEKIELIDYLDEMFEKDGNELYLAIKINFFLGLRVGEITTLKWADIEKREIKVRRQEVHYNTNHKTITKVVPYTKNHRPRKVIFPEPAAEILEVLRKRKGTVNGDDFIFLKDGMRFTNRQFNAVLKGYAKEHGKPVKTSHCIRRTYASDLYLGGCSLETIRVQLGHSKVSTTEGYIRQTLTKNDKYDSVNNVLKKQFL